MSFLNYKLSYVLCQCARLPDFGGVDAGENKCFFVLFIGKLKYYCGNKLNIRVIMKKLNNKGFSAIEALLILIIVLMIGGVIFYVYKAQNKNDTVSNSSIQPASSTKTQANEDKYAGWQTFTSTNADTGYISFKYPAGWYVMENKNINNSGNIVISTTKTPDDYLNGPVPNKPANLEIIGINYGKTAADLGTLVESDAKTGQPNTSPLTSGSVQNGSLMTKDGLAVRTYTWNDSANFEGYWENSGVLFGISNGYGALSVENGKKATDTTKLLVESIKY